MVQEVACELTMQKQRPYRRTGCIHSYRYIVNLRLHDVAIIVMYTWRITAVKIYAKCKRFCAKRIYQIFLNHNRTCYIEFPINQDKYFLYLLSQQMKHLLPTCQILCTEQVNAILALFFSFLSKFLCRNCSCYGTSPSIISLQIVNLHLNQIVT